jgi:hypothetical protein
MFTKLHKAMLDIILEVDEEGCAADQLLHNLGIPYPERDTDWPDEVWNRQSELAGAAVLILLVDVVLGFELKTWIDAVKMIFKYGR